MVKRLDKDVVRERREFLVHPGYEPINVGKSVTIRRNGSKPPCIIFTGATMD
jgi:hypothetical protein